jgi:hypothetical protein
MSGKAAVVLMSSLLFACTQAQAQTQLPASAPESAPVQTTAAPTAVAPADRFVSIRAVNCERLLQLPNEDRTVAAMFYMGYQASRVGAKAINVGQIPSMVSLALSYCTTYPDRPAPEAFAYAYSITRAS